MKAVKLTAAFLLLFGRLNGIAQNADENLKDFLTKASEQTKGPDCIHMVTEPAQLPMLFSADSLAKANNDITGQAAINEQLGQYYFKRHADKSIEYSKKAHTFYVEVNNKKRSALCLQNISFALDEQKHDIPEAIQYAKLAVQAQTELKDTLSQANMYKYIGFLEGKVHNFTDAKKNESIAIELFTRKKFMRGVAVCYRDLATAYEEESNLDSCITNIMLAKNIWDGYHDTARLFDANNILLRVYISLNKLKDAEIVFQKNESMINSDAIQDMRRAYSELLDYYKISQTYFEKKKDDKMVKEYVTKYNELKDNLKQRGYHID